MAPGRRDPFPLAVRLFGAWEVQAGGAPLPRLRTQKDEWLFALLVLRAGAPVERERLAGALWPESTESRSLANLRKALTHLRRALGSEAIRLGSPSPRTLALDLSNVSVDVLAFDAAVARGDGPSLEQAVALYRGPLLAGCVEEWAFPERLAREQAYLAARERLAALAFEQGEMAAAERHLRLAVAVDPLRESTQRALMQVLAAGGNYAAALRCYRELRLHLHRELNTEPDAETQALFQQLRTEACRLPARGSLVPIQHSSHGGRANSVSGQGSVPGEPVCSDQLAGFPRLARPPAPAHILPLALTRFIGREQEVVELQRLLRPRNEERGMRNETDVPPGSDSPLLVPRSCRLVTITGAGGCGKTRLALQVAAELRDAYSGSVWLVELASLADPARVPQAVASALGVPEQPGRSLIATLTETLRPRSLLLVLDNCEHLIEACARLAEALLCACPRLRLLATSRERLNIPGEEPAPLEALAQIESVQLLIDRAQAVAPAFALNERNAARVARVCRRLDGIPLAIELAAARLPSLSIETLDQRLDDLFSVLTHGARTALPRHRTLRALIDWSYDLLSEPERALLRRLSVFAGGWTLEAAEAVCSGVQAFGRSGVQEGQTSGPERLNARAPERPDEVLDLLSGLVEKSLVQHEEGRYRLLEPVRQYGRDRLREAPGEEARSARDRHLAYFLRLAEQAEPRLESEAHAEWLEHWERELDNLRAALEWSEAAEGGAEAAMRLLVATGWFWCWRYHRREGLEGLEKALARAPDAPARVRARALEWSGWLACNGGGDAGHGRGRLRESFALFRKLGDKPGMARLLSALATWDRDDADDDRAMALHEEGLTLARASGDKAALVQSLILMAHTLLIHDVAGARKAAEEALSLRCGTVPAAMCYRVLGWAALREGDGEQASRCFAEDLARTRSVGDTGGVALGFDNLAGVAMRQKDYTRAGALSTESLALRQKMGDRRGSIGILERLALVAAALGQPERAARLLGAAEAAQRLPQRGEQMTRGEREEHERAVAAARAALDGEALAPAWAEGRSMSLDQAIEWALDEAFDG